MEKVCVIGLGYIGLPTASLLATKGFDVVGVDVKQDVIEIINRGNVHFDEPDLDVLVKSAVHSRRLRAACKPEAADVFIIAVPTPFHADHTPDLTYVEASVDEIASHLNAGNLVILESTSPVGTTEMIASRIREKRPELFSGRKEQLYFAHCPERVLPGNILKELLDNDRVVGGVDDASTEKVKNFYAKFVNGKIFSTNSRTAELTKLSENAFRDVNIAFANELSLVCEKLNINVWELIELANRHPRVKILKPGPGVGGHCIAVDPWFIVSSAPEVTPLMRTARQVNDHKPRHVLKLIEKAMGQHPQSAIACLGLAFKADVDDLRESPSVHVVEELARKVPSRQILVVEPHVKALPENLVTFSHVKLSSLSQALESAEIIVLLTDHREFKTVDQKILSRKTLIDTRGAWHKL